MTDHETFESSEMYLSAMFSVKWKVNLDSMHMFTLFTCDVRLMLKRQKLKKILIAVF